MHARELSGPSATHRALIVEWRDRLTPLEMTEAFIAFEKGRGHTRAVETCVADYIAAKTKADDRRRRAWSREQERPARSRSKRFETAFVRRILGQLTPGEIEQFVAAQNGSAANYHRVLRAFFAHARRHRWIASNPFEELGKTPEHDGDEKELLQPDQFKRLLRIAAGMADGHTRREPIWRHSFSAALLACLPRKRCGSLGARLISLRGASSWIEARRASADCAGASSTWSRRQSPGCTR